MIDENLKATTQYLTDLENKWRFNVVIAFKELDRYTDYLTERIEELEKKIKELESRLD